MAEMKWRSLNYRRVGWMKGQDGRDLEQRLRSALRKLPKIGERTIDVAGGTITTLAQQAGPKGVRMHIVRFTPDEQVSLVPIVEQLAEAALDARDPPNGMEYLDGDASIRVTKDDVVICPNSFSDRALSMYLSELLRKADSGASDETENYFELEKMADVAAVAAIEHGGGVKSIDLNVNVYAHEAEPSVERQTIQETLEPGILRWLFEKIGRDPTVSELRGLENVTAKVVLSFDRRREGTLTAEQFDKAGLALLEEESSGITIRTRTGQSLRSSQMAMRKSVELEGFGKTVRHKQAWREIDQYFAELREMGAVRG